jgi:poly-gamma-glutamate capsule biosynthesis protein CapA/YwtB (metallophosphatase superfamily)
MAVWRRMLLAGAGWLAMSAPGAAQIVGNQPGMMNDEGMRVPIPKAAAVDLSRATVADGFTFLAGGDLLGPQSPLLGLEDKDFAKVVRLIQGADVAFANHEGSAFELNAFSGTRAAQSGGGYPLFSPAHDREFKAMGLDIVSMANNHAGDWGEAGLLATLESVSRAGLVEAGAGGSLAQARQAGVFQTPKGRVALIATASTFNPATPAADGRGALKPRPGISTLRTTAANVVTEEEMGLIRRLAAVRGRQAADAPRVRLGGNTFEGPNAGGVTYTDASQLDGAGGTYVVGASPRMTYAANAADEKAILDSISTAKRVNDVVAFSIHAHETAGLADAATPADFLPLLFHKAIDAGADIVIRHGPHELNGIEIYKGKPIFYSLGSLFFGVGGPDRRSPAADYDSAVAVTEFKDGRPAVVRVYPLAIVTDRPALFSAPVLATGGEGQRILEGLRKDSEPFGTRMRIENGVGVIDIPK